MNNWRDDRILGWIDVFSKPGSSWRASRTTDDWGHWEPQGEEECAAFAALTAPENRALLRAWYGRLPCLDASAEQFRMVLERKIGEPLPAGQ